MVTLITIVYEGNFRNVLNENSWFNRFESSLITRKMLVVNNLTSIDEFKEMLKAFPNIDVSYVSEIKDAVIHKYNLGINENTLGYYYTIPYFVAIETIKTKYVLNVASDCMRDILVTDEFLNDSIRELELNPYASTTMVAWTKNNRIMENGRTVGDWEEVETSRILGVNSNSSDSFNCTANFTDQFFFASIDYLQSIDYIIDEAYSNFYQGPSYGGNCFEKRMVANQIKNNKYNCVYKKSDFYIHDKP